MDQIICAREGCCNIVKQTSKYTKRKYCSENNNYCRDFANNNKWQEKRKIARQQGLVKKKYVSNGVKMGNENENIDYFMPTDLQKDLDIINKIQNKYIDNIDNISVNKEIAKQNINIIYTKPKQAIKKKQRGLFDYIFDKWQVVNKNTARAIKHYVDNTNYQLYLF